MAGVNKVILIGNVGGDPEVRTLPSGSKVVNFSLATSENYTDRNGQKQTQTEWHRVELWDSLANIADQYIKKGSTVYIEGKIRTEKWTDQNGVERSGVRIRGLSLQLLGSGTRGGGESSDSSENHYTPTSTQAPSVPDTSLAGNSADDLPF